MTERWKRCTVATGLLVLGVLICERRLGFFWRPLAEDRWVNEAIPGMSLLRAALAFLIWIQVLYGLQTWRISTHPLSQDSAELPFQRKELQGGCDV